MSILHDKIKNIFILNLEREKNKRLCMKYKLFMADIKQYKFLDAVDGYLPEYSHLYDERLYSKSYLGILLGMKKHFKDILSYGYKDDDYVLFLEDDVMFHKDFLIRLNSYYDIFNSNIYDIIFLGGVHTKWSEKMLWQLENDNKIDYYHRIGGAYGISMKISFVRKFLEELEINGFSDQYDKVLYRLHVKLRSKVIALNPVLIIPDVSKSTTGVKQKMKKYFDRQHVDLKDYDHVDLTMNFKHYYDMWTKNKSSIILSYNETNMLDIRTLINILEDSY